MSHGSLLSSGAPWVLLTAGLTLAGTGSSLCRAMPSVEWVALCLISCHQGHGDHSKTRNAALGKGS